MEKLSKYYDMILEKLVMDTEQRNEMNKYRRQLYEEDDKRVIPAEECVKKIEEITEIVERDLSKIVKEAYKELTKFEMNLLFSSLPKTVCWNKILQLHV